MQTAFNIGDVDFLANAVAPGVVSLSVRFRVFNNGPSHVAGIIVTNDFWVTTHEQIARFEGFGPGFENWTAVFQTGGPPASFEFVVFCDDFGGIDSVPRIWNTNGGNRFRASA